MQTAPLEIVFEDPRWERSGLAQVGPRAAAAALAHLGLAPSEWQVAVLACDDARIAALNAAFRGKPTPTDVLSWPGEDRAADTPGAAPRPPDPAAGPELGDLALSWETCTADAVKLGVAFDDHVSHLVVHGVLHLLGYDHESDADATLMERTEVAILASLGLPDPYCG